MKPRAILLSGLRTLLGLAAIASVAGAAEPRPWLCRDKPAFSDDKPMRYDARAAGGEDWQIFLMQFEPNAQHDGFEIVSSHGLATAVSGHLEPGRYFAVAMYRNDNGHWICHPSARPLPASGPRLVTNLCFSDDDDGSCQVTLRVEDAASAAPSEDQTAPTR
jgi:hypothetical protein